MPTSTSGAIHRPVPTAFVVVACSDWLRAVTNYVSFACVSPFTAVSNTFLDLMSRYTTGETNECTYTSAAAT